MITNTDSVIKKATRQGWLREIVFGIVGFGLAVGMLANKAYADEPGVVLGTLKNFLDYYNESMADIRDNGGSTSLVWYQWDDSPGLGPINVLPEFSDDLGLKITPLYLLDVPTIPFEFRFLPSTPEIPATNRKVVGITEDEGFTDPHIPPLRWTADGRLGVESQVGGSLDSPAPVSLYLLSPEKLNQPFVQSPAGPMALVMDKVELPFSEIAQGRTGSIQHTNICDPYIKDEGARQNPYSCGISGEDDCYDVTLISAYVRLSNTPSGDVIPAKLDKWDRVMGTPLHIRVSNPKTAQATIEEVTYGESKLAPKRAGVLFETITPADGRLLIARRGFLPLIWQNQATGESNAGSYDMVYSVAPPEADPCDVSHWGDLYPITHAPYDPRVNQKYPFAMQPFRDPSGAVIPDGVDIKGTYPWMDKEAKNFSVQVSPAKLFPSFGYDGNPQSRYPLRCVSEDDCSIENMRDSDNSKDNMFMLIGAWTQGKMVLVDGMLNDVDFRLGGMDRTQSYLSLYKPGTGNGSNESGEVRVGSTRGATMPYPVFGESGELIGRYNPANLSMLDSIENRLNYLPNMKPSRFHDVVWNMSSGHSTVEFSFDDYLNPDGFIVSNMVAHMQHQNNHWYRMNYYDGWHQLTRSFNGQVRVQNSATALPDRWKIPAYGRVYNGRMEPVANGGIRGKGVWFNGGNTRIEYSVPEQPKSVYASDWFYSLFIDPRFSDDNRQRVLMRFPDGSEVAIKGRRSIVLKNSHRQTISELNFPALLPERGWSHLALLVGSEGEEGEERTITAYLNGYPFHTWSGSAVDSIIERNNFRPTAGVIRLGRGSLWGGHAFKGWMDEFKVFAYEPNLESVCNFGHGTLVGLPSGYSGEWRDTANQYQQASHDYVALELSSYGIPAYHQYACYHDYSDDNQAHLFNIPGSLIALRDAINFPEGPLYHDAPRPDSSANEFCLSCHHDNGVAGLGLNALSLNSLLPAKDDPRRQPTQPPAKLYGNVPANWFPGAPGFAFDAGSQGVYLDEWMMASAAAAAPEIRNLVLETAEHKTLYAIGVGELLALKSLPNEIALVRANVNGLVTSVIYEINGYQVFDDAVPFTFSRDLLDEGENIVNVTAYQANGAQVSESFSINIE